MSPTRPWWEDFRSQMLVVQKWAYFDHAGVSPLPRPTSEILAEWAADTAANGTVNWMHWRGFVEQAREFGAELLGAQTDEIAVIRNTTEGVNIVAEGFPWKEGDNVVTLDNEFPTNLYPWMNLADRGVETRQVATEDGRVSLDRVIDACNEHTRLVSVSWVGYQTGWRNDLAALADIAHNRGALLFVDGIQALGAFPLDVSQIPVDFLAADGHKWLLGPEGAGLFYMRGEHVDWLRPTGVGWNSVRHAGAFTDTRLDVKPNAGRYEGGSYNMGGIAGLAESLRLLHEIGIVEIADRLLDITDRLCQRLEQSGGVIASCREGERRSGIVVFELPGRDPEAVKQHCRQQNVILNCRAGRTRISPHVYTNDEDMDRLMAALADS